MIQFCNGYLDETQLEAVFPSVRGDAYILCTKSGNQIVVPGTAEEIRDNLDRAGLLDAGRGADGKSD